MTTGESSTAPSSELSAQTAPDGQAMETAPISGTVTAPPKDARQLEQEIERTREQLGQTVEELVARVDVKRRAQAKAAEISQRAQTAATRARETVWDSRADWMPAAAAAGVLVVGFAGLWMWRRHATGELPGPQAGGIKSGYIGI